MTVVLYVGGSKDGDKGVVPYGFSKSQAETERGPETYVERFVDLHGGHRVRVMALENMQEEIVLQRATHHLRPR